MFPALKCLQKSKESDLQLETAIFNLSVKRKGRTNIQNLPLTRSFWENYYRMCFRGKKKTM